MDNECLKKRLAFLNQGIKEDTKAIQNLFSGLEKMVVERSAILDCFEAEIERKLQEESK